MNIVVCIDDRNGMLFMGRRQSRDGILMERIAKKTSKLYIFPFSEKYVSTLGIPYETVEDPSLVPKGETLFVEDRGILPLLPHAEQVTVYLWNRAYPGDFFLDFKREGRLPQDVKEFAGKSHEKITEEIYSV